MLLIESLYTSKNLDIFSEGTILLKVVAPPPARLAGSKLGMRSLSPDISLLSSRFWDTVMKIVPPRKLWKLSSDKPSGAYLDASVIALSRLQDVRNASNGGTFGGLERRGIAYFLI